MEIGISRRKIQYFDAKDPVGACSYGSRPLEKGVIIHIISLGFLPGFSVLGKGGSFAMGRKKSLSFLLGLLLVLIPFFVSPVFGQTLSDIYISPAGYILGSTYTFNPRFPSYAYVNGIGLLVWVEMEMPGALIEIYSDGYLRLLQEEASAKISYDRNRTGRIRKIDKQPFVYSSDGRIIRIGDLNFEYANGQLRKMGDLSFSYDGNGRLTRIGRLPLVYRSGLVAQIAGISFEYDSNGRIARVGDVSFTFDYGKLKKVSGEIPGVSVIITSVVEIRKRLP
jgi:hypothetical protein